MAKIGYIMVASHYDRLDADRQWMKITDSKKL